MEPTNSSAPSSSTVNTAPAPKPRFNIGIAWGSLPTMFHNLEQKIVSVFKIKGTQPSAVPGGGIDVHPENPRLSKISVPLGFAAAHNPQPGDTVTIDQQGNLGLVKLANAADTLTPSHGPLHDLGQDNLSVQPVASQVAESVSQPDAAQAAVRALPDMPRYQSHKIVRGAKITSINSDATGRTELSLLGADGALAVVGLDWMKHFAPELGGYLVEYENGYVSYSPADAFEKGYSEVNIPVSVDLATKIAAPSMRCKMLVTGVKSYGTDKGGADPTLSQIVCESYQMTCVGGDKVQHGYPEDGTDEDNDFAKWSPSGNFEISCNNPALFGKIKQGEKYYVDFTLANPAPVIESAPVEQPQEPAAGNPVVNETATTIPPTGATAVSVQTAGQPAPTPQPVDTAPPVEQQQPAAPAGESDPAANTAASPAPDSPDTSAPPAQPPTQPPANQ
jgi:hypothetical protein